MNTLSLSLLIILLRFKCIMAQLGTFDGRGPVCSLAVADGYLYVGGNPITKWYIATMTVVANYTGHSGCAYDIAVANNKYLYARAVIAYQWHLGNTSLVRTLRGDGWAGEYYLYGLAVYGEDVFISSRFQITRQQGATGVLMANYFAFQAGPIKIFGEYLFALDKNSPISVAQFRISNQTAIPRFYNNVPYDMVVSGDFLFTAQNVGVNSTNIYQWSLTSGLVVRVYTGHTSDVLSVTVDGNYIYTGSADQTVGLWEVGNSPQIRKYSGHTGQVNAVVVSGHFVFSGSSDSTIKQWCSTNYIQYGDSCITCPSNAVCSGDDFACSSGYYRNGSTCEGCPLNSVCSSLTNFTCSSGYFKNGSSCLACPVNAECTQTDFTCNSGHYNDGNSCAIIITTTTASFTTTTTSTTSVTSTTTASTQDTSTTATISTGTLSATSGYTVSTETIWSTVTKDVTNTDVSSSTVLSSHASLSTSTGKTSLTSTTTSTTTPTPTGNPTIANKDNSSQLTLRDYASLIVVIMSSTSFFLLFIQLGLAWRARRRLSRFNSRATATALNNYPKDWSSNKNQMGFSEYNSHTFNSYAIADSIKQLLLVPNSNSQQINMAACTTTLSFAENKRALFVPGHYQVEKSHLLPMGVIFQSPNCEVLCCTPLDEELARRSEKRALAVKYLKRVNASSIDAFKQEISIMHFFQGRPNFVQLVGFSYEPMTIITDLYLCGSLYDCLLSRRTIGPTVRLIVRFARQISTAVCEMHLNGFSHSDLKPQNIFVDKRHGEYFCFLGDFGLSRVLDESNLAVKAYKVMNTKGLTIRYAAPEMLRMRNSRVDLGNRELGAEFFLKSDIYSLALIMFELAIGDCCWH